MRGLSSPKNDVLERDKKLRNLHFLWVSEVTLGSFSPPFFRLLRPHCHGVSPSGGCSFARSFLAQERRFGAGQVAQKSSFSMGFRSYVRQFFAAFFPPSPSFTAMVFPRPGAVVLRGLSSPKKGVLERDKKLRNPHSLWVSEVTLGSFLPPFLRLLRPSLPWCFPVRGLWFCAVFPRPRTAFWSGTSSSEILILYGFQKLR